MSKALNQTRLSALVSVNAESEESMPARGEA
jgi:hypothetical protein